jgi:hypothetical protein
MRTSRTGRRRAAVVAGVAAAAASSGTPTRASSRQTRAPMRHPPRTGPPKPTGTRTTTTRTRTQAPARPVAAAVAAGAPGASRQPVRSRSPTTRPTRWFTSVRPARSRTRSSRCVVRPGWRRRSSGAVRDASRAAAARRSSPRRSSWPAARPSTGSWSSGRTVSASRSPCSRTTSWSSTMWTAPVTSRTSATCTWARCRTCCLRWRPRSSMSARAVTRCSTRARSTGTLPGWRASRAASSRR